MSEHHEEQWMNMEIAMHVVDAMVRSLLSDTSALNESEQDILSNAWHTIQYKVENI
jgi:hypothetical protein|tara:strand:+ start:105 stop:272 length:168 start_codon:yes stop_codon:yes gene_type:complete